MFTENIDQFFSAADFGVTATAGANTCQVIFDSPENFIGDGNVISAEYKITYKTGNLPGLAYGSSITVDGVAYTVNQVYAIEDGRLTTAELSKV
jgi:hypothetical protein